MVFRAGVKRLSHDYGSNDKAENCAAYERHASAGSKEPIIEIEFQELRPGVDGYIRQFRRQCYASLCVGLALGRSLMV